jgi:hypothetical protein
MRWMSTRLAWVSCAFTIATVIICLALRGNKNAGLLSFSINIMVDACEFFSYNVQIYNELKVVVNSSERVMKYTRL